jgi:hypothetical protein
MIITIHHHLGLGDHFVCNGLVNFICKSSPQASIHLICKKHNLDTVKYLYSENTQVRVISMDGVDEISIVNNYVSKISSLLIRVGFENCDLNSWDTSFYKQLNIDFIERYRFFKLPRKKPEQILQIPDKPYILIHDQSSKKKHNLHIDSDLYKTYIIKQEGYHLLSYLDIINNAEEIHCIDSASFHLIDSLPNITNKLYYHNVRKNVTNFNKSLKWKEINYEYFY